MDIQLLHDPKQGDLPGIFARRWRDNSRTVDFKSQPDGLLDERCGRCNRHYNMHVWQLVDPDDTEQDGVIDCGLVGEGR